MVKIYSIFFILVLQLFHDHILHIHIMTYKLYIGGEFKNGKQKLSVYNPYNNKLVGDTFVAEKEHLEDAIKAGKAVEKEMKLLPVYKKYEILQSIAKQITERKKEMALVLAEESGKPLRYALGEIDRSIQTFTIASEECKRIPSEYFSIDWTPAGHGKEALIKQLTFPVKWSQSLVKMKDDSMDNFIEIGPGNVLQGMVKRTVRGLSFSGIDTVEQVNKFINL